jgi:hypothetical protein
MKFEFKFNLLCREMGMDDELSGVFEGKDEELKFIKTLLDEYFPQKLFSFIPDMIRKRAKNVNCH